MYHSDLAYKWSRRFLRSARHNVKLLDRGCKPGKVGQKCGLPNTNQGDVVADGHAEGVVAGFLSEDIALVVDCHILCARERVAVHTTGAGVPTLLVTPLN